MATWLSASGPYGKLVPDDFFIAVGSTIAGTVKSFVAIRMGHGILPM